MMSNTFKILANSLFGVMMTRCEKFKDFKIVTKESQVDKQIKKLNFSCRNIINENLTILEMEKTSVIYIQNSENNNCERHEVNDQFGSFQLQYCNHRQPMK